MSGTDEFWTKVDRDSEELRGEVEDCGVVSFSEEPNLNLFLNLSIS